MNELFKILMTDTADRSLIDWMVVDGMLKLFPDLNDANLFCEDLNRVAREENQTWRYEASPLTQSEQTMIRAQLTRDMF